MVPDRPAGAQRVGGVSTLVIAVRNADSVVADDWYKRGLAINLDLERERVAADLGIAAAMSVDPDAPMPSGSRSRAVERTARTA